MLLPLKTRIVGLLSRFFWLRVLHKSPICLSLACASGLLDMKDRGLWLIGVFLLNVFVHTGSSHKHEGAIGAYVLR